MALINELIGNFGKYQLFVCFIIFFNKFCAAFHQMAIIFLAPPVEYGCPNNTLCCENPIYNTTVFKRTIVMEWNLICNRSWMKDFNQTVLQLGVLIGSLVFGIVSDKYGRRLAMNISVIILIFSGIIATFAPDFWTFSIMRMFIGVSVGGVMVVGFVILMEFVGTEIRDVISALFHLPFTLGHVLLVAFGYFIRDYFYFHLAISLTAVYLFFYICLLPESPRWLLAVNKTTNAITLIERVAKVNSLPTEGLSEKILLHQAQITQNQLEKGTIVDLFRKPNLRKNLFIMSFNWFVCGFCYYGVSQYVSHLSGNIFINVAATGGVTVCSIFISIILMKCLGRKTVVIISSILCGTCLLIMAIVPEGSLSIVFGCIGNLCCFITFIMVYLFCSEMFPTVVRNAALGICSTMARVGGMIAPFIVGLKYYSSLYPPILFGALPLIAAVLCMFLPETKNCELMTTIEEGENFAKRV